jgi:hypothetical protein
MYSLGLLLVELETPRRTLRYVFAVPGLSTAGGFHGFFAGHSSGWAFSAQTMVARLEGFLPSSTGSPIRSEAGYPRLGPAENPSIDLGNQR